MNKLLMKPIGGCIAPTSNIDPVCSSHMNVSKYIQWVPKEYTGNVDIEMYIDDGILTGLETANKFKYGWLLESRGYNGYIIDELKKNLDLVREHYKYIFTFQLDLVSLGEPFVYTISNGAPWTRIQNRRIFNKTKLISMLVSNETKLHGHRVRTDYMKENIQYLDLFGRGYNYIEYTDYAYMDYMFTVSMENDISDAYFTERLTSPMTTFTIPIYRGSSWVVERYFNPKGVLYYNQIDLKDLTPELYQSMLPYAEENYKIACRFPVADDFIYENYFL